MSKLYPKPRAIKRKCPICKRLMTVDAMGYFVGHGPGPMGFYCEGSHTQAIVKGKVKT